MAPQISGDPPFEVPVPDPHHDAGNGPPDTCCKAGISDIVVPWDKDTFQDEEMARYGIAVYIPLHILTCTTCKLVIDPWDIDSHIHKDLPHAKVDKAYCKRLRERFSLVERYKLRPPATLRPAIPNLRLYHNCHSCSVCFHAFKTRHSLITKHHCPNSSVIFGYAQAYFPYSHQGALFAVTLPPSPPADLEEVDFVEALKSKYRDPDPEVLPIVIPQDPRDTNHFLKLENWGGVVQGLSGHLLWNTVRTANQSLRDMVYRSVEKYVNDVNDELGKKHTFRWGQAIGSYSLCVSCLSLSLIVSSP